MSSKKKKELVLESSLQSYFFDQLQSFNNKSTTPLPLEMIHYSSKVMERFSESDKYFNITEDGRVQEKTLGMKLLNAANLSKSQQIRELKDIGDTSLFLCGYFSESLSKKLISIRYYEDVGRISYERLNCFVPSVYNVERFYYSFARLFTHITLIMNLVAQKLKLKWGDNFDPAMIIYNLDNKIEVS